MSALEFKEFMTKQVIEINKYKSKRMIENPELDQNQCIFDWIDQNASDFYKNWKNNLK